MPWSAKSCNNRSASCSAVNTGGRQLATRCAALHVSTAIAEHRYALHQVVPPSAEGAALCVRDATTGLIHARTWVGASTSPRIDATLRTLKAWKATRARDVDSLKAMLRQPENMWMQEPYAG